MNVFRLAHVLSDIRSYNIFVITHELGADVNVKIGDFGLSVHNYINLNEPLESWQWLAPEVSQKIE